jgi:hypothetical protein
MVTHMARCRRLAPSRVVPAVGERSRTDVVQVREQALDWHARLQVARARMSVFFTPVIV